MKKPFICTPPSERLRELLEYDPETGNFFWCTSGRKAGTVLASGYVQICIDRRKYYAHRIAWAYVYGEMPADKEIDHIDLCRANNRISNLRLASRIENTRNNRGHARASGLPKGVYKYEHGYRVRLQVNRRATHVGVYKTIESAAAAYEEAAKAAYGQFARTR